MCFSLTHAHTHTLTLYIRFADSLLHSLFMLLDGWARVLDAEQEEEGQQDVELSHLEVSLSWFSFASFLSLFPDRSLRLI